MVTLEYYDKLLLGIAGSLALGTAVGLATSVAFVTGLAGGAMLATVFVYEAMFRNPPLPTSSTAARAAAVVWHVFLLATIAAALT